MSRCQCEKCPYKFAVKAVALAVASAAWSWMCCVLLGMVEPRSEEADKLWRTVWAWAGFMTVLIVAWLIVVELHWEVTRGHAANDDGPPRHHDD